MARCSIGAGSFGAELRGLGGEVVSVDPAYGEPRRQLLARARKELRRGNRYVAEHAPNYVWRFFDSPAAHHAARRAACETFAADIRTTSQHYLAAALPTLPFPDGSSQGPVADSGANPRR